MQIAEGRWEVIVDGGHRIEIRAAEPSDAEAVRGFFEGLSEDARWLRFHSPTPIIRPWMVDAVVHNDHEHREALLALHDGRVIGVAEWGRVIPESTDAHVAIVVDDRFRRRGVARELMRHLAASGRNRGIEEFTASVLSVNRPTMSLIQNVAPQRTTTFDGPVIEVRIPLSVSV
jgi:ribosomal protein S18 acetylase RimI-like enzyme